MLIFDCLRAYLSTCQVYKHGIFQEDQLLNALLKFKNSSDKVLIHSNKAMKELVLFSSVELLENRLQELLNYTFEIIGKHKDTLDISVDSGNEFQNEDQIEENLLASSSLDILQSIAIRFEKETHSKHIMISEIMNNLNTNKWAPSRYASRILISISSKSSNHEKSEDILQDNITQVFIHIYKKINGEFVERNGSKIKIPKDQIKAQVISILEVLSELYQFRSESHAFNHTSNIIVEVFKNLWDIEPKIEEPREENVEDSYDVDQGKSDVYHAISKTFTSYFDNLVFRQSVEAQYINELPSINNRLKVTEEMILYGQQNDVFNIIEEGKRDSEKIKKKGKWNYIQLIQLAISILYSSRLAYDKSSELKMINTQKYSFENFDFDRLINPIIKSINNDIKVSKKMLDLVIDWINKMLKYQQMFNSERSDVFSHWMISMVPILATKTGKTLLLGRLL